MILLPSRTRLSITWAACGPSGTFSLYVVLTFAPIAFCTLQASAVVGLRPATVVVWPDVDPRGLDRRRAARRTRGRDGQGRDSHGGCNADEAACSSSCDLLLPFDGRASSGARAVPPVPPFSPPAPRSPNSNLPARSGPYEMCSGTSSNRSTSTSPRSVILRWGITDSPRKDERQERRRARPAEGRRRVVAGPALGDHVLERSVGEQPRDRAAGIRRARRRRSTATMPPPSSASRATASAISSSLVPTTTMLCASWATVDASAPRCSPEPPTNPIPMRPVARCRSTTAILTRSRPGSATAAPSTTVASDVERLGDDLVLDETDRSDRGACERDREVGRRHGLDAHASGAPSPVSAGRGGSSSGRPRLRTTSGTKPSRSGRSSRSAW